MSLYQLELTIPQVACISCEPRLLLLLSFNWLMAAISQLLVDAIFPRSGFLHSLRTSFLRSNMLRLLNVMFVGTSLRRNGRQFNGTVL